MGRSYCGFPKSKVFTKTLLCLFPARHQSLYLYQVSYVGVCARVTHLKSRMHVLVPNLAPCKGWDIGQGGKLGNGKTIPITILKLMYVPMHLYISYHKVL